MKTTCALIVTYYPDENNISSFINRIIDNVGVIIIIDNTPEDKFSSVDSRVVLIKNGINKGIAYAQNQGIFEALKRNISYIFFFDQDSNVPRGYFDEMLSALAELKKIDKISAVGPNISGQSDAKKCFTKKDFLISSGTLIETDTFKNIGLFDSGLFIDMVDVEWCHRARKFGHNCYIAEHIPMKHNIYENNYPKILGKEVRIGSPVRQYYLVRNWILCIRSDSFNALSKLKIFCLLLKKIPLFMLCTPRNKRTKYILEGVFDGLNGKNGPYQRSSNGK